MKDMPHLVEIALWRNIHGNEGMSKEEEASMGGDGGG
jgi:hypothetical protein